MSDEKTRKYQICTETVMDTSDPDITFDKNGVCNHAHRARSRIENECFRDSRGESILENIATKIKESGKGKKYDCVLGLSGGADSSYVAVKAANMGLRPIAVHLDNGWNTDVAVSNIERILRHYNLDLYTHVVNWQEFRDIQRSLFQSSLPNIEVATDHAIFALLYKVAVTFDIK
jgi:tRNA(Ile)-lysidine synthase TilS/MesJ